MLFRSVVVLSTLMLRRLKARVHDPAKIAYLKFCDKLRRKGMPRDPAEGPVDYARRLEHVRPDLASAVTAITQLYIALRYGAEASAAAVREFQHRVNQFSA